MEGGAYQRLRAITTQPMVFIQTKTEVSQLVQTSFLCLEIAKGQDTEPCTV